MAPFAPIATLEIKPQNFNSALRITECEHLTFTPWHGLVQHRPLGGINRRRKAIYLASATYRLKPKEPSGFPD